MDRVNGITWISLFGLIVVGVCYIIGRDQETLTGFYIIFFIFLVSISADIYNLIILRRTSKHFRPEDKK